jgi:hypothetical protein
MAPPQGDLTPFWEMPTPPFSTFHLPGNNRRVRLLWRKDPQSQPLGRRQLNNVSVGHINDAGQIVATGTRPGSTVTYAILLSPTHFLGCESARDR